MRKPRDFDAELKALEDKARDLKARKGTQLGELVIAAEADTLTPNELAGALVVLAETKDAAKREAWAKRGAAFFAGRGRSRGAGDAGRNGTAGTGTQKPHGGSDVARSAATSGPDPSGALPLGGPTQLPPGGTRAG